MDKPRIANLNGLPASTDREHGDKFASSRCGRRDASPTPTPRRRAGSAAGAPHTGIDGTVLGAA